MSAKPVIERWTTTRMWEGQQAAILGGGAGLTVEVVEKIRNARTRVIAVNNAYQLAPWADIFYAADPDWWRVHWKLVSQLAGMRVSCSEVDKVLMLKSTGLEGFDANPACIRTGNNSGYQAVHLAAHLGAKRILLCGFDMRSGHWHKDHERPLRSTHPDLYIEWVRIFKTIVAPLQERGIEVLNCTPGSALTCFPIVTLDEALMAKAA